LGNWNIVWNIVSKNSKCREREEMIEKKQRIEINLDKHTYDFIKSKNINASKLIRQLLRVALFSGSTNDISAINDIQSNNPVEVAGRVRLPSRA